MSAGPVVPGYGQLDHQPDCQTAAIVRHDGTRYSLLACSTCGASITVPRRCDWRDPEPGDQS